MNVTDLHGFCGDRLVPLFAWTGPPPCSYGFSARWFATPFRDTLHHPYICPCFWKETFWGAEGAPILFSDLGLRMASCSYIYIYIPPPHSASYNIAATTTCASRVSVLVGHRKRAPPVQVTVATTTCVSRALNPL